MSSFATGDPTAATPAVHAVRALYPPGWPHLRVIEQLDVRSLAARNPDQDAALVALWSLFEALTVDGAASSVAITKAVLMTSPTVPMKEPMPSGPTLRTAHAAAARARTRYPSCCGRGLRAGAPTRPPAGRAFGIGSGLLDLEQDRRVGYLDRERQVEHRATTNPGEVPPSG